MNALLGRTMLVVAHPDDETGSASIILQRSKDAMVVFCTDGAPEDPWFWNRFGSREAYAAVRRREALEALSVLGVRGVSFLSSKSRGDFRDQGLHQSLPAAIAQIEQLVRLYAPDTIITSAYEGGHPDHDACSFICNIVGQSTGVPVWEVPLYHRTSDDKLRCQTFADSDGTEQVLVPTAAELTVKEAMLSVYRSQPDLAQFTCSPVEFIRQQKDYDYTQPPSHAINYESWGWKIRAEELCENFKAVLDSRVTLNSHSGPLIQQSTAVSGAA